MKFPWAILTCLAVGISAGELKLSPGCTLTDGRLDFKNGDGSAEVVGSEKFGSSGRGLTVSAAVLLSPPAPIAGSGLEKSGQIVYSHDIIASKGTEFVFGRRGDLWVDQLYCNFHDGREWAVPLKLGVKTPPCGKWAVWTVTLLPFERKEEGRRGTILTFYLNGEPRQRLEVDSQPVRSSAPVRWGTGQGIKNELWPFHGTLAETVLIDRALNDDEVLELAGKSKLVKITPSDRLKLPDALDSALRELASNAAGPVGRWAVDSLRRAGENGYDLKKLDALLPRLRPLLKEKDESTFSVRWNQSFPEFRMLCSDRMIAMLATGSGHGVFPLVGIYDRKAERGIFGRKSLFWEIEARTRDGSPLRLTAFDADWQVSAPTRDGGREQTLIQWKLPQGLSAESRLVISDGRVETDFRVANQNPDLRIENVGFPMVRLSAMTPGRDFLVHPRQSGILCPSPTVAATPEPGWYPSGWIDMQFGAYYDQRGGVYFSPEDPTAAVKLYTVRSRSGNLELGWSQPAPYAVGQKGGNSFRSRGMSVLELFSGDWFAAAQCYKRFVRTSSRWNEVKRPRTDTPGWLRENTLWVSHWTFDDKAMKEMPLSMKKLRDYLELPFAIHWYRWYNSDQGGMPHFVVKKGVVENIRSLHESGIRVKAYIDTRLWSEVDGPGYERDWEFTAKGKNCAVINADGTFNYERYHKECREVVMCPCAALWQEKIFELTRRTASYGFDMIYHDQVGASRPFICYAKDHGHDLNSNTAWVDGYYRMFDRLVPLRRTFPELCHNTEDANDAYLPLFDGFLPWRWTEENQIPLFAAIYSGYTQFTGREYNQTTKGDPESFFVKAASQLVQSEQIGWFILSDLLQDPERLVFIKQAAHLRKQLLPYFNEGEMLEPLKFRGEVPVQTLLWGAASTKPRRVTLPKILHSVWLHPTLGRMVVWVNTTRETVTVRPEPGTLGKNVRICRMDSPRPANPSGPPEVTLAPRRMEVWIDGSEAQAEKVAAELFRIASFSAEKVLADFDILSDGGSLRFDDRPDPEAFRGGGCFTLKGNGKSTVSHKFRMALEPDCAYRLRFALRKDSADGYYSIANYSADGKLKNYVFQGQNIPNDGKWHEVEIEFKTDRDLYNCGLYLYNRNSAGILRMDEVTLRKVGGPEKRKDAK